MKILQKIVLSVLYFLICSMIAMFTCIYVGRKINDIKSLLGLPLPDFFLDLHKGLPVVFVVTEKLIITFNVCAVLYFFFHTRKATILYRFLLILGHVYLIRGLIVYMTMFPVPNYHRICSTEKFSLHGIKGIFKDFFKVYITFGLVGSHGKVNCGDNMYSGHTAILTVAASHLSFYLPQKQRILCYLIWLLYTLALLCITVSHMHYSMDIIIAIFISRYIFTSYMHTVFSYEIMNNVREQTAISNDEVESIIINEPIGGGSFAELYRLFGNFLKFNPLFSLFEKDAMMESDAFSIPFKSRILSLYNKFAKKSE